MSFFSHLSVNELSPLLHLVEESHGVRRHVDLLNWLQNEVQRFLPHQILIAAWGDFSLGLICYDIVSPLPGMRTESFDEATIHPFLANLFSRWEHSDYLPFTLEANHGINDFNSQYSAPNWHPIKMQHALVHGIKDQRGRHDCLYILMGDDQLEGSRSQAALRFLLPYIDTAFRQIAHLPDQYYTEPNDTAEPIVSPPPAKTSKNLFDANTVLSEREQEIMHWVKLGKTNQEIGQILDISAFTVKNHLQRIFKKLNVLNRAQAVASIEKN